MDYPSTRTEDVSDNFHGTDVADPYRWLEDQNSPEVQAWAKEQATHTEAYLATLPGRGRLSARLAELSGLPASGPPEFAGDRWFRLTNDGTQQQAVLRVAADPFGAGEVLIDPNPASADASTALAGAEPDPTGKLVAWSYQEAGSDWCRWRVRQVASGLDTDDELAWSKFCRPLWLADSSGFLYIQYPPSDPSDLYSANTSAPRLMLHLLGTDQDADQVLFHRPELPSTTVWPGLDDEGRWLVAVLDDSAADTRSVWVRDLRDPAGELRRLTPDSCNEWALVTVHDSALIMWTDFEAGRGRLVRLDPMTGQLTTLVAEGPQLLLGAHAGPNALVLNWLADAHSEVSVHDLDGARVGEIELPSLGSVSSITASRRTDLVHLAFSSYQQPPCVLSHDLASTRTSIGFAAALPAGQELTGLVTDQIWITSADGTRLPAFVVHRDDVLPDGGPHPCVLYGYGGFNVSLSPNFSPLIAAFAEAGGVWVVANLRGGGEYGAQWHDAGRLARKQNVFDDAIATAEQLIAAGWTSPEQLAVNGGSNGGLLVGALLTQRPDLFAAAVAQVGVLDMLRYDQFTIGWAWASDYGIASRSKAEFDYLYTYSPYHRLRTGVEYPAVLVTTADHDDRVVPAHSFKFAARLQAVGTPEAVSYLRVEYSAGHGLGKSRSALLTERTDLLAFIARHTGLTLGC